MNNLSEAKQIEFKRRKDVMCAIVPLAGELEIKWRNEKALQDAALATLNSKWLVGLIIIGGVFYWAMPEHNIGIIIGIIWVSIMLEAAWKERTAKEHLFHITHQLAGINCKWRSVSGYQDLSEIRRFISDDELDFESDEYAEWMQSKLRYVLGEIDRQAIST
jgi:hypothetical protein